jgi:hypothetical protein
MSHQSQTFLTKDEAEEVLEHFGVKGMRWGVRRSRAERAVARYKDTPAPKKKTPEISTSSDRQTKKNRKEIVTLRRKLSDDEINSFIGRLEKEKKLKSLLEEDISPAKTHIKKALLKGGTEALSDIVKDQAKKRVGAALATTISESSNKKQPDSQPKKQKSSKTKKSEPEKKKRRLKLPPKKITQGPVLNVK